MKNQIPGNLTIRCRKSLRNDSLKLDFYLVDGKNNEMYAFTRRYSKAVSLLFQHKLRVSDVVQLKSRNQDVMKFVAHMRRNIFYLLEYYELKGKAA